MSSQYDAIALAAALRYGVPAALVRAIILAESSGDPNAYNPEGGTGNPSRGLMQIRESTARGLGFTGAVERLFDPRVNIDLGAKLLRQLWDRFGGVVTDVVAAYNGGPRVVKVSGGPYVNQSYVDRVLEYARQEGLRPAVVGPVGLLAALLVLWYWRRRKRGR